MISQHAAQWVVAIILAIAILRGMSRKYDLNRDAPMPMKLTSYITYLIAMVLWLAFVVKAGLFSTF
jgi:hypothetical protein